MYIKLNDAKKKKFKIQKSLLHIKKKFFLLNKIINKFFKTFQEAEHKKNAVQESKTQKK